MIVFICERLGISSFARCERNESVMKQEMTGMKTIWIRRQSTNPWKIISVMTDFLKFIGRMGQYNTVV